MGQYWFQIKRRFYIYIFVSFVNPCGGLLHLSGLVPATIRNKGTPASLGLPGHGYEHPCAYGVASLVLDRPGPSPTPSVPHHHPRSYVRLRLQLLTHRGPRVTCARLAL